MQERQRTEQRTPAAITPQVAEAAVKNAALCLTMGSASVAHTRDMYLYAAKTAAIR